MTAAPNSRPVDERLKAAIDELNAASTEQEITGPRGDCTFPHGCQTVDALAGNWDRIEPTDDRWQAIRALLDLDQAQAACPSPATIEILGCAVCLLTALVEIDADGREVQWKHVEDFHCEMDLCR
jgi:hypothetical protein